MKAIVQESYGSPDVLAFKDIDKPVPSEDEVLVRVRATSIHPGDYIGLTGVPYLARVAFGLRAPKNMVPGRDVAGTVEAVGDNVTGFQPGDELFGWSTTGVLSEFVCAGENQFVSLPPALTSEQAATVTVSATTALQALRDRGEVKAGQKVLINGASGGVGTFAIQIAKSLGAEVTAVCSTRNIEMVRGIGADHVIDYTKEDFTANGVRYDLILDNVGSHPLIGLRRSLTPRGILIPNSGTSGGRWTGTVGRQLRAMIVYLFLRQKLRPFVSKQKNEDLVTLKELIEAGKVRPVVDKTFSLADSAAAFRYVGAGHSRGKVVVAV